MISSHDICFSNGVGKPTFQDVLCLSADLMLQAAFAKAPSEIQTERNLSSKEVFRTLRKLDDLGLIELHSGNRVKLPRAEFGYFANGKLLQRMKKEWAVQAVQDGISDTYGVPKHFTFYYLRLSDQSFAKLSSAMRELVKDFTRETVKNVNLKSPGTREYRMISAVVPGSYVRAI